MRKPIAYTVKQSLGRLGCELGALRLSPVGGVTQAPSAWAGLMANPISAKVGASVLAFAGWGAGVGLLCAGLLVAISVLAVAAGRGPRARGVLRVSRRMSRRADNRGGGRPARSSLMC